MRAAVVVTPVRMPKEPTRPELAQRPASCADALFARVWWLEVRKRATVIVTAVLAGA